MHTGALSPLKPKTKNYKESIGGLGWGMHTISTPILRTPFLENVNVPKVKNKIAEPRAMTVKMIQWNCHSLSSTKFKYLTAFDADLWLLQEIWQPEQAIFSEMRSAENEPLLKTRLAGRGGGTMLWPRNLVSRLHRKVAINQDCNLYRLLLDRDKIIWVGSIYLSKGTPAQLKLLFKMIFEHVPAFEWKFLLLGGDFNLDLDRQELPKVKLLNSFTKQFGLKILRSNKKTFGMGELDFLLCGDAIKCQFISLNKAPSDHHLLVWQLELQCPERRVHQLIPNRRLAEAITNKAWESSRNSVEFLRSVQYDRARYKKRLRISIKRKSYKKPQIQALLDASDDQDALETVRLYFSHFNKDLEDQRFSNLSKDVFRYLKKVYKYDSLGKREGSIVSCLKDPNTGTIVYEETEVHKEVMKTIRELQLDLSKPNPRNLKFPTLDIKPGEEMKDIIERLWTGKAITWDGVSDIIFSSCRKDKTKLLFADLWTKLNQISNIHFEIRLILLNKNHPQIGTRTEIRPIAIMSPVVKLIEAGLLPDLTNYLLRGLHVSQTGFVPGTGIFVNIFRAIGRIKMRTEAKERCFGVFVDFSSAYNTLDHQLLFERLTPILGEEKTQLIRALYSRLKLKLGKETVTPNQGVAQGSVISPALFNIYAEGLLQKIELEGKISSEDILAYADDVLVICRDLDEVSRVIRLIREWSNWNNMKLNDKKSGLVEFIGRRAKVTLTDQTFQGFPICKEYKYLGLRLNNKLQMAPQLDYISTKARDIHRRLQPFLFGADLDIKKNMWQIFIQPHCEFVLPLLAWEQALGQRTQALATIRGSFKLFSRLKNGTPNNIVDKLSGYQVEQRATFLKWASEEKWQARKERREFRLEDIPDSCRLTYRRNLCKWAPKELVDYINLSRSLCYQCHIPNTTNHISLAHGVNFPSWEELLDEVKEIQEHAKLPRRDGLELIREIVKLNINKFRNYLMVLKTL